MGCYSHQKLSTWSNRNSFYKTLKNGLFLQFLQKKIFLKGSKWQNFLWKCKFIKHIDKIWRLVKKFFEKNFFFWKKLKNSKFSIFQNFIALLDISLYSWNFAHMLVHPKTTSTPKIIVLTQKMKQIYHFLCF